MDHPRESCRSEISLQSGLFVYPATGDNPTSPKEKPYARGRKCWRQMGRRYIRSRHGGGLNRERRGNPWASWTFDFDSLLQHLLRSRPEIGPANRFVRARVHATSLPLLPLSLFYIVITPGTYTRPTTASATESNGRIERSIDPALQLWRY